MLRRQISRVRYEPGDRLWLAALSRLIPRRRWGELVRRLGSACTLTPLVTVVMSPDTRSLTPYIP